MFDYLEKITRIIYKDWKRVRSYKGKDHPDEESLACFLEDKLAESEKDCIQKHILSCDQCAEYLSVQIKIQPHLSLEVPQLLLEKIQKTVINDFKDNLLEIFLLLKEKALEIIQTTGDVLVGQELVPAPVLRSRKISEFKEEINIIKDLAKIRITAKIQNKATKNFNLAISVKDKQNQKVYRDLRVTLLKDGIELESYTTSSGTCLFENILFGDYLVEIIRGGEKEAIIDLKVKI